MDPIEAERQEIFYVQRTVDFHSGPRVSLTIRAFTDEQSAKAHAKELTEAFKEFITAELVKMAGKDQVRPLGMTAQQLLINLGVVGYDHHVMGPVPVHSESKISKIVPAPKGGIVLP